MTTFEIPTVETENFRLRAPQMSDLDAYTVFGASYRSAGVGGPFTEAQSFQRLAALIGHWGPRGFGRWMVADKDTNEPLGVVGLMYPSDWPETEIAWTVFEKAEGKGVAYECALAARKYGYDVLGLKTLISCTMEGNTRSEVLAQRMGATCDADFAHPDYGTMRVWRHLPPEACK